MRTGIHAGIAHETTPKQLPPTHGAMSDGSTPRFLQGAFEFEGNGLDKPALLDDSLRYVVPPGSLTQPVYFRGGNSTDELITVVLFKNRKPMRYVPIAAKGATHVALRVVEDLLGDTVLELFVAAPSGLSGTAVVDLGLVEI
ncbi:MAG: hypothetical protein JWQ86_1588 [Mycobacterium sp.]|nr:hypothetical protein [Mycobacterium sp.]MDT5211827.1 hypothetical protein [Mycobacterium sp.]